MPVEEARICLRSQDRAAEAQSKKIALISAPWPLFNRPSIQLGSLKSFLVNNLQNVHIEGLHLYLSIAERVGFKTYETISTGMWRAETPYAALLYPEKMEEAGRFFLRRLKGTPLARTLDFRCFCQQLHDISSSLLNSITWDKYILVGLSACLGQLTSSIYFAREIKKRASRTQIVLGGSACAKEMGLSIARSFPEIDYIISGEGEIPLLNLARHIISGIQKNFAPPGVIVRTSVPDDIITLQTPQLDQLPMPDFTDYFSRLAALKPKNRFIPRLPMEASRGCWWKKPVSSKKKGTRGCAFCNLNLQWSGYRVKSGNRISKELDTLSRKHKTLSVSFMDNCMPYTADRDLFHKIKSLNKDLKLFCEVRVGISLEILKAMADAGVYEIQAGIEAISTSLLKKLNKGTTAMDNLELIRNCERLDTPSLNSNLIMEFPSSDAEDVEETLRNIEFAIPFSPPTGIKFWLGYGSSVWSNPVSYGIRRTGNHPYYKNLFPDRVLAGLILMLQGYRGGRTSQHTLWMPVRKRLVEWRREFKALHSGRRPEPVLSYQDGESFLLIRHRRNGKPDTIHRLEGTSRSIYLFCEAQRTVREILSQFPGLTEEKLLPFLRMMVEKRLMFSEVDRYLSLSFKART